MQQNDIWQLYYANMMTTRQDDENGGRIRRQETVAQLTELSTILSKSSSNSPSPLSERSVSVRGCKFIVNLDVHDLAKPCSKELTQYLMLPTA